MGKFYRILGEDVEPFNTLQTRLVLNVSDLMDSGDPEGFIDAYVDRSRADLKKLWADHKDRLLVVEGE